MLPSKLSFLASVRFWTVVIGAALVYLQQKGYISDPLMVFINTVLGGSIAIKTVQNYEATPPTAPDVDTPQ